MIVRNRKVRFDYEIVEEFEAGISLSGVEVKAFRRGAVDIAGAFGKIIGNEAFLVNAMIDTGGLMDAESVTRSRRLLLHRKEIDKIVAKIRAKKLTLVPISMYTKGKLVKVKLGLGKHKRKSQKREKIKMRDIERDVERELKGTN